MIVYLFIFVEIQNKTKHQNIKVLRIDDVVSPGELLVVPLGWELDEVKNAAFKLVYPGNGDAPLLVYFYFVFIFIFIFICDLNC